MNTSQLITALSLFPPDTEVLVAKDEEGNGFNKLYSVHREFILKGEDKHGYVDDLLTEEDIEDYRRAGRQNELEPRVVIWP